MALIPPFFLDCVVAIGRPEVEGKTAWTASGFLYGSHIGPADEPGKSLYHVYLVTNRHVFEEKTTAVLRLNPTADEPAREYRVPLVDTKGEPVWFKHPRAEIDVAVLPVVFDTLRREALAVAFFQSDKHMMTVARMIEAGVSEGDPLFVLGFPMALVGERRNTVIVRRGTMARVRDCLAGASPSFLADSLVFPGNSGGPVITCPEIMHIEGTKSVQSALLVGIVAAYIPYRDVAVSPQTGRPRVVFEENSGLTAIHPVDYVGETIEQHLARTPSEVPPATPSDSAAQPQAQVPA